MESLLEPWISRLEPYPGESLSHYLGRFREENVLTVGRLAAEAGLGGVLIKQLEYFRHNPFPTASQLTKLADFMELPLESLLKMLPTQGIGFKLELIRLCLVMGKAPIIAWSGNLRRPWGAIAIDYVCYRNAPSVGRVFKCLPSGWGIASDAAWSLAICSVFKNPSNSPLNPIEGITITS